MLNPNLKSTGTNITKTEWDELLLQGQVAAIAAQTLPFQSFNTQTGEIEYTEDPIIVTLVLTMPEKNKDEN